MELIVLSNYNCSGCDALKKKLKENEIAFREINITDEPEAIGTYRIRATPVLILEDEGEEFGRMVGYTADKWPQVLEFAEHI